MIFFKIGTVHGFIQDNHKDLPYLGLKLHSLNYIADHISPRLANKLLHEQQELIHLAINNGELNAEQGLINFSSYQLSGTNL